MFKTMGLIIAGLFMMFILLTNGLMLPAQAQLPTLPLPTIEVTVGSPTPEPTPAQPTFVDFMEDAKTQAQNDPTLSVIVWLKSDAWFVVQDITRTGADWVCYRSLSSRGALIAETCVMTSEISQMVFDRPSVEPTPAQIGGQ